MPVMKKAEQNLELTRKFNSLTALLPEVFSILFILFLELLDGLQRMQTLVLVGAVHSRLLVEVISQEYERMIANFAQIGYNQERQSTLAIIVHIVVSQSIARLILFFVRTRSLFVNKLRVASAASAEELHGITQICRIYLKLLLS